MNREEWLRSTEEREAKQAEEHRQEQERQEFEAWRAMQQAKERDKWRDTKGVARGVALVVGTVAIVGAPLVAADEATADGYAFVLVVMLTAPGLLLLALVALLDAIRAVFTDRAAFYDGQVAEGRYRESIGLRAYTGPWWRSLPNRWDGIWR